MSDKISDERLAELASIEAALSSLHVHAALVAQQHPALAFKCAPPEIIRLSQDAENAFRELQSRRAQDKGGEAVAWSPGRNYAERFRMAVTEEWVRGWDACHFANEAEQPESRPWEYCPECGSNETWHEEGEHKQCAKCGQEWFSGIDYTETVRHNLSTRFPAPPASEAGAKGEE